MDDHAVPKHGVPMHTDIPEGNETMCSFQKEGPDKALYFTDKSYFISRYTKPVFLFSQ